MSQLSFFSAETDEPSLDDLAGLLAASGQSVTFAGGVRVSVVVDSQWRAEALAEEITQTGLTVHVGVSDEGSPLVRTESTSRLRDLHQRWTRGAIKTMPAGWVPSPRSLRMWVLAAGVREADRYLLALDPHAVDSHAPLATAVMRAGIAPTLVGTRGHHPALRIAGKRRLTRLLESIGDPPSVPGAAEHWPTLE